MNPDGRTMRRFERELKATTLAALQRLRDDLFDGVTEATVMTATARLDDPRVLNPFRDRIVAQLQRIAIAGAEFGREQVERHVFGVKAVEGKQDGPLSIDWQLANNDAAEWALRYGYDLVRGLNDTTRKRLQVEIANFIQNGETLGELIERIEDVFGPVRAELVSVTEVTRIYARANEIAWRESQVVEGKTWATAQGELVCPLCSVLDEVTVPLGEAFPEGGGDGPPRHPRCRCWLRPALFLEGEAE